MENKGKISIYPSVIKQIILESLKEIDGVIGISKPSKNSFFRNESVKDLEVEMTETECVIDMSVVIEYGCKLNEIAEKIQEVVEKKIEDLTNIRVKEINVNIVGVSAKEKIGE